MLHTRDYVEELMSECIQMCETGSKAHNTISATSPHYAVDLKDPRYQ